MNLGLAIYGRSFTLKNNSNSIDVGTATNGGGLGMKNRVCLLISAVLFTIAGPYTKESGTLAYFEVKI